jgi:hypothetical protein
MHLQDADSTYRNALLALPRALEASFADLVQQGPLPLEGLEVTRALLLRLSAFYEAQVGVDKFLNKLIRTAAADFFVETLAFYLKALVTTHQLDAEVAVERRLQRTRGSMRPDISLWRSDQCLACIECKTQLGWNRGRWEAQFLERERRLLAEFTGAPTFLVVLTGLNWGGFGDHPQLGVKYFLLLSDVWPTTIDLAQLDCIVSTPVEGLLARIAQLAASER